MKPCRLTITTTADGVENTIVRDGEMEIFFGGALLCYREENALVSMKIQGKTAEVLRQGDYSLHLHLKEGAKTEGSIGIGGSDGGIKTVAHKIHYSVSKDSFLLSLRYDLLVSGEKQEMKLRLLSRSIGEPV